MSSSDWKLKINQEGKAEVIIDMESFKLNFSRYLFSKLAKSNCLTHSSQAGSSEGNNDKIRD